MARTHSIMRIATTASPVSGAEVSQRTPGSVFMANIFIFIHPYPSSIHPSIHSLCQAHTNTCAHTHARAYTHTHTRCATRLLTWPRRPGSRRRWESYRAPVCVQRQPKDLLSTSLTPSLARSLKQSQPRKSRVQRIHARYAPPTHTQRTQWASAASTSATTSGPTLCRQPPPPLPRWVVCRAPLNQI